MATIAPSLSSETTTVSEAARRLGVGRSTAYLAAKRGELPTVRLGRRVVVPIAALDRLLSGELPKLTSLPTSDLHQQSASARGGR